MRNEELVNLGIKIREIRILRGMSQTELANMMGMDQPNMARIENGKVNIGVLTLIAIAKALDVEIKDLV